MNELQKFYFTFGIDEQYPFQGGWVEIHARDINSAVSIFKAYYPNLEECEMLNCSDYYTEKAFETAGFKDTGNFDAFCHQIIKPISCDDENAQIKLTKLNERVCFEVNGIEIPNISDVNVSFSDSGKTDLTISCNSPIFEIGAKIIK